MTEAKHGTRSGYVTHLKRWKTEPCAACRRAHADNQILVQRAQRDAIRRLKALHPAEWDAIYTEEKQRRGL